MSPQEQAPYRGGLCTHLSHVPASFVPRAILGEASSPSTSGEDAEARRARGGTEVAGNPELRPCLPPAPLSPAPDPGVPASARL